MEHLFYGKYHRWTPQYNKWTEQQKKFQHLFGTFCTMNLIAKTVTPQTNKHIESVPNLLYPAVPKILHFLLKTKSPRHVSSRKKPSQKIYFGQLALALGDRAFPKKLWPLCSILSVLRKLQKLHPHLPFPLRRLHKRRLSTWTLVRCFSQKNLWEHYILSVRKQRTKRCTSWFRLCDCWYRRGAGNTDQFEFPGVTWSRKYRRPV